MVYTPQTWTDLPSTTTPLSAARLGNIETGIADAHAGIGGVALDSFAGGSDDAKLTAAMSYAAAQSFPPFILLNNRSYSFTSQRTLYNGFRLRGPGGIGPTNPEKSSTAGAYNPCKVSVTSGGVWLNSDAAECWDVSISGGIGFRGNSSTQFMGGSAVYWCLHLRDIGVTDFKTILGSQATSMKLTLCLIDGWIQFQNSYNGGVHIGGSDNALFLGNSNIDSGASYLSAGGSTGQYHLWFDSLEKTTIGPLYTTGEQGWGAIRVSGRAYNNAGGNNNGGPVWISGAKIEGRNAGAPCYGSLIKVDGGILNLTDSWLGYAMSSPSSMGHSPTDAGVVHQTAGAVVVRGCTYDRASGVAETVPLVYSAGGVTRVSDVLVGAKGGGWTGVPRVRNAGGTVTADNSVAVI